MTTATKTSSSVLRTLVAAVALGALASAAQAVEMRGFRGVAWGEGSNKLGDVTLVSQAGAVSCYQRTNENLLFGDSPVQNVRFCFNQDRLFLVSIESAQQASELAGEFVRTYGKPTQRSAERMRWAAHAGQAQAEVMAQTGAGSTLRVFSAEADRKAVQQAVTLISAAAQQPQRVALLSQ